MTSQDAMERDQNARHLARTEFDHPVVLEAGAGTGKTAVLVARVLTWAVGPGWERTEQALGSAADQQTQIAPRVWERVIAITFTDAAAAEMVARIHKGLQDLIREHPLPGFQLTDLIDQHRDKKTLIGRCKALELHHQALRVTTIHAFCHELLRRHALEASLHPRFTIDASGQIKKQLLSHHLRKWMVQSFRSPVDDDAQELLSSGITAGNLQTVLFKAADLGARPSSLRANPYPRELVAPAIQKLFTAAQQLQDLTAPLAPKKEKAPTAGFVISGDPVASFQLFFRHLLQVSPEFENAGEIAELCREFPPNGAKKLKAWIQDDFKAKDRPATDGHEAQASALAEELLTWVKTLARFDLKHLPYLARVLADILEATERDMERDGVATFMDLLTRTNLLLESHPPIADDIRQGCDQLLVDEFQDTNPIQYDLVRMIALEGKEQPGLFLVGDPKQSIYAWRQADLQAYAAFLKRLPKGAHRLSLTVNFRSVPSILTEVDHLMQSLMREEPGVQPPFESLHPSPAHAESPGIRDDGRRPIEYWISGDGDKADIAREREADAIAKDILDIQKQDKLRFRDHGILLRTKNVMSIYTDAMERHHVPYQIRGDQSFYQRREIEEASLLIRAALDPHDRIALLGWMRSATVGVPDAALLPLWEHGFPAVLERATGPANKTLTQLREAINRAADHDLVGGREASQLPHWPELLLHQSRGLLTLRAAWHHEPLDLFVFGLRTLTNADYAEGARYLGARRLHRLQAFYDILLDALRTHGGDVDAILRLLRELSSEPPPDNEKLPGAEDEADGVRIMTIHNAKGLDFENLYIADLHRKKPNQPELIQAREPNPHGRFTIKGKSSAAWKEIQNHEEKVQEAERIRLLYVAITRARSRVVLCGAVNPTRKVSTFGTTSIFPLCGASNFAAGQDPALSETRQDDVGFLKLEDPRDTDQSQAPPARPALASADIQDEAHLFAELHDAARKRRQASLVRTATEHGTDPFVPVVINDDEDHDEHHMPLVRLTRDDALDLGTHVHRVLEILSVDEPLSRALPAAMETAGREYIQQQSGTRDSSRVLKAAEDLLSSADAVSLLERFHSLGDHLLGREVPLVLHQVSEDDLAHATIGVADFLYRDPETQQIVIGDWKNDRTPGDQLQEKAQVYASQGRVYQEVVQQVFQLKTLPRFELWFLRTGQVVAL